MPIVSVVLPIYNNERTVMAAVQSILTQTFSDFELILINDGSSDGTQKILSVLSDSRIKIMGDNKNIGLPRRLNQGVAAARGQYIARMDADDVAHPERLEKQVTFLNTHPDIDVLATRAVVFENDSQILGLLPFSAQHKDIVKRPWHTFPMPHPTWMMRRDWIIQYGYAVPEVWRAEDQELLLRAHRDSQYACLPDVLLCYRQGAFDVHKTLLARRQLLCAQVSNFMKHKEYLSVVLAVAVFLIKIAMDIFQVLSPRFKEYRKHKYASDIPHDVYRSVQNILGKV